MALRAVKERIVQGICLEIGGILLAAPLFAALFDVHVATSAMMVLCMATAEMIWSPLHNFVFDVIEWRRTGQVASDRTTSMRFVHAMSHEISSILVTTPVIMLMGGYGLAEAFLIDLGFTAVYTAYVFLFHLGYDRARPVAKPAPIEAPYTLIAA